MIGGDCDFDGWCYLQKRFPGEPRCRDEIPVTEFPHPLNQLLLNILDGGRSGV